MFNNLHEQLVMVLSAEIEKALANYKDFLTAKEVEKIESGKKTVGDYTGKVYQKVYKGYTGQRIEKLRLVELDTRKINSLSVSVEWYKSRIWGMNPQAELTVYYESGEVERLSSSIVSGCGYDKLSTATAKAFNQCLPLLKLLYAIKEENPDKDNRECIGYGSGYGILPYFEGGVGFNCHQRILEKLGFTMVNGQSGKTFDTYTFVANN